MITVVATKTKLNGVVNAALALQEMSLAARDSLTAHGPVAVDVGGTFTSPAGTLTFTIPALSVSFPDNLPFVMTSDAEDAEDRADLWIATMNTRIAAALAGITGDNASTKQTLTFTQI